MDKKIRKMINTYFHPTLDLRVLSFNVLAFTGMAAGIVTAVLSALLHTRSIHVVLNIGLSLSSFALLRLAEKRKCYRFCGWITVIVVFILIFPVLFFTAGGYRSGMPCFFILAFIFSAVLLEKYERFIVFVLEFIIYIACCVTAYYHPETVTNFQSEAGYVIDVINGIVISSVLLLLAILQHVQIYSNRQLQMQELNRELEKQNKILAQYDRMKNDFLETVAHEIGTPLAIISASSNDTIDLLMEGRINTDEIIENQRIIVRRIKLIGSIIHDLMDTVAIENGRFPLKRQLIYLSDILENVCDEQFKQLDANNNQIVYAFQPNLSRVWADPQRIEQIIINLLSNAVRHTKSGIITINLKKHEKTQIVSVLDNGEGMDAEMARVALRRYASTKADYWRHGIGLYVCRQIIAAHGGEIWIDSEKGKGTCISFSLSEEAEYV